MELGSKAISTQKAALIKPCIKGPFLLRRKILPSSYYRSRIVGRACSVLPASRTMATLFQFGPIPYRWSATIAFPARTALVFKMPKAWPGSGSSAYGCTDWAKKCPRLELKKKLPYVSPWQIVRISSEVLADSHCPLFPR